MGKVAMRCLGINRMAGSLVGVMSPYLIDRHSRESGNPVPSGAYGISMDTRFRGYDEDAEWNFGASITTGDIAFESDYDWLH